MNRILTLRLGLLVVLAGIASPPHAQTTAGTSATIVVPVIAQTSSFGSEVTLYNPNASSINVNAIFYDAQNTASPGAKPCTTLSVGANVSNAFTIAAQCALPPGSNFGLLVLSESTGTQRFYGYARTQTPQGIGFSTEGFPIENFNDQIQHATGLKRVAASGGLPAYQTNCFVATLGGAVSYELRLFDGGTNAQLGSTLSGSLTAFQQFRYLDVFAAAGVPAGNKTNVRAQFTNLTGNKKKLIGFCTVQENTQFSADFRIAKSYGGTPQNAFVQGGNAFGVTALLGTLDNEPLELNVNNQRAMRFEPNATAPNVIGGHVNNGVYVGVVGATVAGGGAAGGQGTAIGSRPCLLGYGCLNGVTDGWGTIGGGAGNQAGDGVGSTDNTTFATVGGGFSNWALNADSTVGGGSYNTAGGENATVAGGNDNTASGYTATISGGLDNTASGSSATVPGGYSNNAGGDYSFAAGNSATIPASAPGTFFWNDHAGPQSLPEGAHDEFIVIATNGIGMYTYKDFSHGCALVGAAGSWSCTSDRATKDDFTAIDPREVLAHVVDMPIMRWRWKGEAEAVRHIGPTAQDFRAAFGLGYDDKTITLVDSEGVALAAIQGLHQLVQKKDAKIEAQQREIEAMRGELDAVKRAVAQLTGGHASVTLQCTR